MSAWCIDVVLSVWCIDVVLSVWCIDVVLSGACTFCANKNYDDADSNGQLMMIKDSAVS